MSPNLQTVQNAYRCWHEGELETAFASLHDECVLHGISELLPAAGPFRGRAEILGRWLPALAANFEDVHIDIERWIDGGESVCMLGTMRQRVTGTPELLAYSVCHVWRFGADGRAVEIRFFGDSARVLRAVQEAGVAAGGL